MRLSRSCSDRQFGGDFPIGQAANRSATSCSRLESAATLAGCGGHCVHHAVETGPPRRTTAGRGAYNIDASFKAPMVGLGTVAAGLGTVGIMALQCMAGLGVIGYFRGRSEGASRWSTLVAPLLAFAGMTLGVVLAVSRFDLLSGASNRAVNVLPVILVAVFVGGALYGVWLRKRKPGTYRSLSDHMAPDATDVSTFTP